MSFQLDEELLRELKSSERWHDDGAGGQFRLDGGLGPVVFLSASGEVMIDSSGWDDTDGFRPATQSESYQFIAIAARSAGIPRLNALLPSRPLSTEPCVVCQGTRFAEYSGVKLVCQSCDGLGWASTSMTQKEEE